MLPPDVRSAFRAILLVVVTLVIVGCENGSESAPRPEGVTAGNKVSIAGWDVRVVGSRGSTSEATAGNVYDIQVSAWFSADGATTFAEDVGISALGSSGLLYVPRPEECEGALPVGDAIRPDQAIEGFVCFAVEPADSNDLQLVLTPIGADGGPIFLNTPAISPATADDFGPEELVAALRGAGVDARTVSSPYARSGYLERANTEQILCLDQQESILYQYADQTLREADSAGILPTGQPQNGAIDLYYGRLMWWAKGRVIVNYNFAGPQYWDALTTALGPTISPAGDTFPEAPNPLPASDVCG